MNSFQKLITALLALSLTATAVLTLVFKSYHVPSSSMEPAIETDAWVLGRMTNAPEAGDIVVMGRPQVQLTGPALTLKRVLATGPATVEISDNEVFVDGAVLDEPYLAEGTVTEARFANAANCVESGPNFCTFADGYMWVMGDNRSASADSRVYGPVRSDLTEARVVSTSAPRYGLWALLTSCLLAAILVASYLRARSLRSTSAPTNPPAGAS